ncbi:hypothetical protein [Rhodoferax sp.]|uniref:hypothetical protein n=1 Tax=Rhodoferax sp. TaxID=50421 RepID=UPI00374D29B6
MADSDKTTTYGISADPSGFVDGMNKAADSAKSAASKIQDSLKGAGSEIEGSFKKIADTFGQVQKAMLGLTAIIAGGAMFKQLIGQAADWNGEAGKMGKQLGITTEQASVLNVALKHLGIDSDVYTSASTKMSKQIFSNADAFSTLGVAVRDTTTGAYRPVMDVMGEVNQKLAAIHNPIEQNIAGMQVYGKSWQEVKGILKLTSEQMDAAQVRAKELGLIVGPEGASAAKQYKEQMRDLGLVSTALSVQFGNALLPIFTKTGAFMAEEGPVAAKTFALALEGVSFTISTTWLLLKDFGDGIGSFGAQVAALISGDVNAYKAIGKARDEEHAKNSRTFDDMVKKFGQPLPVSKPAALDGNDPQYHFKPDKEPREVKEKSAMGGWEAKLAEDKLQYQEQNNLAGTFYQFSKEQEIGYWRDRLAQTKAGSADSIAVRRKLAELQLSINTEGYNAELGKLESQQAAYKNNTIAKLEILDQEAALVAQRFGLESKEYEAVKKKIIEIERQTAEQLNQIDLARSQSARDVAVADLAAREQVAQLDRQLGLISQAELLAQQLDFETKKNAIALAGLDARMAIAERDHDANIVEINRLDREKEQAEREHQARMAQIKNAQTLERAAPGMGGANALQQGMQDSLNTLLTNSKNANQALTAIWKQSYASFMQEMVTKPLAALVMRQLREIGLFQAMFGAQITGQAAASGAVAGTKTAETAVVGGANAVQAGTGAFAALAAIPIIGPALAAIAGPAMFATVMAMVSRRAGPSASAAGGYDIPSTINPLTQLHASEMVLPAKHADVIRSMADQGQGAAVGGSNYTVHINATDADSVARLFAANGAELVKVLKKQHRNFGFQ